MRLYLLFFKNTKGLNTLVFFSLLLELYVLKYFFCSAYELIYFIPVQNYTNTRKIVWQINIIYELFDLVKHFYTLVLQKCLTRSF